MTLCARRCRHSQFANHISTLYLCAHGHVNFATSTASPARRSIRALSRQYYNHTPCQDVQIKPERPIPYVVGIETFLFLDPAIASHHYLPQARETRSDSATSLLEFGRKHRKVVVGNGRGPTRLMSPTMTFHSCGSSSRLKHRSSLPTVGIRRGSRCSLALRCHWSRSSGSRLRSSANRVSATVCALWREFPNLEFSPV